MNYQGHEQLRDDLAALSSAMSDLRLHIRALDRMSRGRSAFRAHPSRCSGFAESNVPCGLRLTPCLYCSRAAADAREA
ncbi:hypothetical protein L8S23_21385 [Enterobacter bugandensis]|uniref:hypothetical protein n=1 Tax=Enterobacter bugandensis TaxID=881260 RepID=UPI002004A16E|nr:hypothetical protein [Enterobacter bugandensis]MCK6879731.1 hypothetical protein [Enterobacter bugandensis]